MHNYGEHSLLSFVYPGQLSYRVDVILRNGGGKIIYEHLYEMLWTSKGPYYCSMLVPWLDFTEFDTFYAEFLDPNDAILFKLKSSQFG